MIRKMLKSDYEGVRKLMKQVYQLHYVNRPDIFLDGDALTANLILTNYFMMNIFVMYMSKMMKSLVF